MRVVVAANLFFIIRPEFLLQWTRANLRNLFVHTRAWIVDFFLRLHAVQRNIINRPCLLPLMFVTLFPQPSAAESVFHEWNFKQKVFSICTRHSGGSRERVSVSYVPVKSGSLFCLLTLSQSSLNNLSVQLTLLNAMLSEDLWRIGRVEVSQSFAWSRHEICIWSRAERSAWRYQCTRCSTNRQVNDLFASNTQLSRALRGGEKRCWSRGRQRETWKRRFGKIANKS